ncbi:MAG: sugar phosphate isomerase/epimerase [Oscillospiraceae bacterium]|nr:sugar phosphate isomerase/epimerase [Oscillospiraceae bacterium]
MSHWKGIPYKSIPNFRDFYYEDKTNYAYYQSWDDILKYTKACGFDGIETFAMLQEIDSIFGGPSGFVDFVESHGLKISGMFSGMGPGHVKENIPTCVANATRAIKLIAACGGKHLNLCPGIDHTTVGPLTEDGIQNTITCLNEIGRVAEDHGVHMGIHNEFFCIMNKPNHRRIIETTDPKYVHYCLDTAQVAIMGEDLCQFYEDYHDRICTFHMKDTVDMNLPDEIRYSPSNPEIQDDGHRWFWEPGLGALDFEGLYKLMKKYNFQGWATVETDGSPDLMASLAHSGYFFRKKMAKIYE